MDVVAREAHGGLATPLPQAPQPCHSTFHVQTSRIHYASDGVHHSCTGESSKFGFAHNLLQKILGVAVVRGIGVGEFRELYVNRNELSIFQNGKPSLSGVCLL